MDHIQDSFTQRLLQRASMRRSRNSNEAQTCGKEALQRRYNIIKAINDPSVPIFTKASCHDDNNNNNVSSYIVTSEHSETFVLSDDSKIPIMESTRKLPHSDSTRILYSPSSKVTSTISTITISVETPCLEQTCDYSEEMISGLKHDSAVYDENHFLAAALGDELNNESVTYNGSIAWDKSKSNFNASDLMSMEECAIETSAAEPLATLSLFGMQPRSSSTLKRSMKLSCSVEETIKMSSERVSKFKAFVRLLRRLHRDFKKIIGFRASSKR